MIYVCIESINLLKYKIKSESPDMPYIFMTEYYICKYCLSIQYIDSAFNIDDYWNNDRMTLQIVDVMDHQSQISKVWLPVIDGSQ